MTATAGMKSILCLDFDGVLHSYKSGWKGPEIIPDDPVPGAMAFICEAVEHFDVQVFSARSSWDNGIAAMKNWLYTHVTRHFDCENHHGASGDLDKALAVLGALHFPKEKPPAFLTIDDRAWQFTGKWPSIGEIRAFKPWYVK